MFAFFYTCTQSFTVVMKLFLERNLNLHPDAGMSVNLFHNILGDTHQGRLIDKLGNFATENFGEKGLQFFNTLTIAQVSLCKIPSP